MDLDIGPDLVNLVKKLTNQRYWIYDMNLIKSIESIEYFGLDFFPFLKHGLESRVYNGAYWPTTWT